MKPIHFLATKVVALVVVHVCTNAMAQGADTPTDGWPDSEKASWTTGSVPTLQELAAVRPALSKDQVRALIGVPHFGEGFWGVTRWTYLFDINGRACQFRVDFEDGRSKDLAWRTAECAALLN